VSWYTHWFSESFEPGSKAAHIFTLSDRNGEYSGYNSYHDYSTTGAGLNLDNAQLTIGESRFFYQGPVKVGDDTEITIDITYCPK